MPWLRFEEQVLASVAVVRSRTERRWVLPGREASDGTVLQRPTRSTHTVGMRSAVDGADLDRGLHVLRITSMARSRVGRPVSTVGGVVEAPAGSVDPRGLLEGGELEVQL